MRILFLKVSNLILRNFEVVNYANDSSVILAKIQGFKTEKDATLYLNEKKRTSPSRNFSIIIFNEDINSTTRRLVYKIRTPKTIPGNIYISNFNTSLDVPYEELGRMSPTVQLQICLDEVFIKTTTSDANALTEVRTFFKLIIMLRCYHCQISQIQFS